MLYREYRVVRVPVNAGDRHCSVAPVERVLKYWPGINQIQARADPFVPVAATMRGLPHRCSAATRKFLRESDYNPGSNRSPGQ